MEKDQEKRQKEKSTPSLEEKLTALEKELLQMGSKRVEPPRGIRVRIYPAPKR
jgi:hypothetical protein